MAERDVRVQRRVLEARRRLDRGDDLPCHAELGEAPERGLLVGAEVAHGLVETDQPLLDQILCVAAGEEVRARLQPDKPGVAAHERVERLPVAVAGAHHQLQVRKLSLELLRRVECLSSSSGHRFPLADGRRVSLTLKLRIKIARSQQCFKTLRFF